MYDVVMYITSDFINYKRIVINTMNTRVEAADFCDKYRYVLEYCDSNGRSYSAVEKVSEEQDTRRLFRNERTNQNV